MPNKAPTISGTPATTAAVGQPYSFAPDASDPDRDALTFSIANPPAWASFDAGTGALSGTPGSADVGEVSAIAICASDGYVAAPVCLGAFGIAVGAMPHGPVNAAVSVAFTDLDPDGGQIQGAPTFTPATDGSDVSEYRLYWGQDASTKLAGNDTVIATVPVGGGTTFAAFPADTLLPTGATHFLVFTANADGEMATGVSVLIVDLGVPVHAAVSVAFTDLDPDGGQIEGAPTFTPAADERDVSEYRLYWGQDASTKLAGNDTVIATVPVGGGTSFAGFPADTLLPTGATHFLVFTANAGGEMATGVSVLIVDLGVPVHAAVSVAFTDLDPDAGQIQGAPTFMPATDESDVSEYRLYWGQNATTKLAGNDPVIATVPVGGGTSFAGFPADTLLPTGATHFLVFTANAGGELATGVSVPIVDRGPVAYVTNRLSNDVSVIDRSTNTVTATVTVGSSPIGVAITPDGNFAYVINGDSGTVSVIDRSTNTVTATITVGSIPHGIAITPDGSFAYVTNSESRNISVIATASNTVTATFSFTITPYGIAITTDGSFAYVTNFNLYNVSVISTVDNTVTATVVFGSEPSHSAIAITPDGNFAYVIHRGDDTVSVIATASNTVTATITVPASPRGVAITPDGNFAYVPTSASDTVAVIDISTNTVTATITVGDSPHGVAIAP